MTYSFTCEQGHEPKTFTVDAENEDEAVQKLLEQTGPHVAEAHPDMANMSPAEAEQMIRNGMKAEG
ncbi:MAG: hypothetical protein WD187_01455 [Candidatus Woykebacteria bacterium]